MKETPPWHRYYGLRSGLIIPRPNFQELKKASQLPIGFAMMELDGVPQDHKAKARVTLVRALRELDWSGKLTLVRASTLDSGCFEDDIESIAAAPPDGFIVAKPQSANDIRYADSVVSRVEKELGIAPQTIKLAAMIERIQALQNIDLLAAASPRMIALLLGLTDLGYEVGYRRTSDGDEMETYWVRARVLMAAHLAGLIAVDTATLRVEDLELAYKQALFGYQMGFDARICVTTEQIDPVNRAFSPSESEIVWAKKVMAVQEHASQSEIVDIQEDRLRDEAAIARAAGILRLSASESGGRAAK